MRESQFIEKNKDKWKNFESLLHEDSGNPKGLREQFIQITDDLSFSRTFYKNRSVRVYLNGLAQLVYHRLIKNKGNQWKGIKQLFANDIQQISYNARHQILLAFFVAMLGFAIGFLTTAHDPEFPVSFFGSNYVELTKENIKKGDPLGIYKSGSPLESFFGIAANNLRVAFLIFAAGLLFSFGALAITLYNGIMVGVFMCFFYQHGIVKEFHLTVWMHGTIEMLTMVVECAAGILLGKGLLFPGTYSRSKAFFIYARQGAMLMLVSVPLVLFAAFVEGYVTRFTDIPDVLRLLFILACLVFMAGYFVWFPYKRFHGKETKDTDDFGDTELFADRDTEINSDEIKSFGKVFAETAGLLSKKSGKWTKYIVLGGLGLTLISFLFFRELVFDEFVAIKSGGSLSSSFANFGYTFKNLSLLLFGGIGLLVLPVSLWFAWLTFGAFDLVRKSSAGENIKGIKSSRKIFISSFCVYGGVLSLISFAATGTFSMLLFLFLLPLVVPFLFKSFVSNGGKNAFSDILSIGKARIYISFIYLLFMFLVVSFFIYSPLLSLGLEFVDWIVRIEDSLYEKLIRGFFIALLYAVTGFLVFLYFVWNVLIALTHAEIIHAGGLKKQVEQVGVKPKFFGMETE